MPAGRPDPADSYSKLGPADEDGFIHLRDSSGRPFTVRAPNNSDRPKLSPKDREELQKKCLAALVLKQLQLQQYAKQMIASRKQRELYVGNLTIGETSAATLMELFNGSLSAVFKDLPAPPVVSVSMSPDGKFAFLEFCTPEMAAAGLNLNGIVLNGRELKVGRRPGYFDALPTTAPLMRTDAQGNAEANLDGLRPSVATARAANVKMIGDVQPTLFVQLENLVQPSDLVEDSEYYEVVEDVREECKKHGGVLQVVIPRPGDGLDVPGVGRAFIHFETLDGSSLAQEDLDGRHFGENVVKASFITKEAFDGFADGVL